MHENCTEIEQKAVTVRACPHPFKTQRVDLSMPEGMTLQEMVHAACLHPVLSQSCVVFVDDLKIERHLWPCVRPKSTATVYIRVVPMDNGQGGTDPLRTVLQIAVLAAAIAAPPLLGLQAGSLGAAAVSAGIAVGGSFAVNAIAPVPQPKLKETDRDSPTFAIQGARNTLNPFGIVPRVLGKHRMFPPLGARTFTEIVGDDQYLRMLVIWGFGPVSISNLKIGETPLTDFTDVETQTRQGFPSDTPLTLFSDDIQETALSIELKQVNSWSQRTTDPEIDQISIDLTFPNGIVAIDGQSGEKKPITLEAEVEYKLTTAGSWTSAGSIIVRDSRAVTIRRGLKWDVTNGQYDVRIRRVTADTPDPNPSGDTVLDAIFWTALRSIKSGDPVKLTGLAKTALRIKATGQLNGVVDTLNGEVQSLHTSWNGATWVADQPTSNPADLFRSVLQDAGNAKAVADSRVDLTNLQDWHLENSTNGREFNMVIDFDASVNEVLDMVAAAGRAAKSVRDGKWGVVMDRAQSTPIQHVTPRNSWGFTGNKVFLDPIHALRVRFINLEKGWQQDERIVYDDGFDENNATKFEGFELPGVTDPEQAWKDARYRIATARLRPETYTFFQDIENIVYTRGDLIRATHDVPLWGVGAGRVKSVQTSGSDTTGVTVDELLIMEMGKSYSLRFRKKDGDTLLVAVNTVPGETDTFVFTTPVTPGNPVPEVDDLSMFGETGSESVELVVRSIEPGPNMTAKITCVDAAPAVHTAESGTIPPFDSQITTPVDLDLPFVTAIRSDETVLILSPGGEFIARILITLGLVQNRDSSVINVETQFRPTGEDGAWEQHFSPKDADRISLTDVDVGKEYDIRIRFNTEEKAGDWTATFTHTVIGTSTPPPDVEALFLEGNYLRWDYPNPPVDFKGGGFQVRYNDGADRNWDIGTQLHKGFIPETEFNLSGVPRGTKTIMVAAFDKPGNRSTNVTSIIRDLGDQIIDNIVEQVDLDAFGYPGTITDGTVSGSDLEADSDGVGDASGFWTDDADPFWPPDTDPFWTDNYKKMIYEPEVTPAAEFLDAVLKLALSVTAESWSLEYRQDSQNPFWENDSNAFWTGDSNAFWQGGFTSYKPWPGQLERILKKKYGFRVTTIGGTIRGVISNFDLIFDVPDQVERIDDFVVAAAGARLPITKSFRSIKNVNLTLHDGSAVSVKILDKDELLGPNVRAFDSGGSGIQATVDATIQGVKGL